MGPHTLHIPSAPMFEQPRLWLGCRVSLSDDVAVVYDWQEERLRRGDDLRLRMAIEESQREKAKPEEVCVCVCVFCIYL